MKKEDKRRLTRDMLKQWYDTHQTEYCNFVDMMHDRRGVGYTEVYKTAIMMVPKYEKALLHWLKDENSKDIDNLENLLKCSTLGGELHKYFTAQLPDCIVPAMLCWLFFGRSFEAMVEYGEDLIKNPNLNFMLRRLARVNIRIIINRSLALKARTEEDWVNFVEEQEDMGTVPSVTAKVVSGFKQLSEKTKSEMKETSKKQQGRAVKRRSLEELIPKGDDEFFSPFDEHVTLRHSGKDLAMLYLVLEKECIMAGTTVIEFHAALEERYKGNKNISIPGARGIQDGLKYYLSTVTMKDNPIQVYRFSENKETYDDICEKLYIDCYKISA